MRSKSTTSIAFGLVNIPVGVYTATESHDVKFHQYHIHDKQEPGRIAMQRVCAVCDQVVAYADLASGVDLKETGQGKGEGVVIVTDADKAAVHDDVGKTLEVLYFVHADEIDPIGLESPAYLAPPAKASTRDLESYATLRTVLAESERVGIVRYSDRSKTHLAVLRARGDVLVMQNMAWPDEIREPEFAVLKKRVSLNPKLIKVASALMEAMQVEFNPADYTDAYTERMNELIEAKAAGQPLGLVNDPDVVEDVADLMAALQKSIDAHPAGRKRTRGAA
jgi:DNA end-binding protein Ku